MEEVLNFSQTQRIVFLIDLHPLFTNPKNPNSYISSILSTSQTLLTFTPLSNSLFTFKFFFSSLSPLLSSSRLRSLFGKSSPFFSFDRASQTLISLSQTLNSINLELQSLITYPKADLTASSICQLVHDYIWEAQSEDFVGKSNLCSVIRSNLIIILSPVSRDLKNFETFLDLDEEIGSDVELLCENFVRKFSYASEGLVSRDIHCCWIDVGFEIEDGERKDELLVVFLRGIKRLGWGFCSTDAIVLGSLFVPFGMIYPKIGCSLMNFCPDTCVIKDQVELSLTITDVSGKPLECNCCDLELLDLKHLNGQQRHENISGIWESSYVSSTDCIQSKVNQITKICIKEVWKNIENLRLKSSVHTYVLLRGSSLEHKVNRRVNSSGGFFADVVLEKLCMEQTEFTVGKPIWPVFLSFLYRNKYWALVSVSRGNDESLIGILKPFTVHSAIICILDIATPANNYELDGLFSSLVDIDSMNTSEIPIGNVLVNRENRMAPSEHVVLSQAKTLEFPSPNKKNHRKSLKFLESLSWSSLQEAALGSTNIDLEDIYLSRECHNSKKIKFVKCWMKQTKKSIRCLQIKPKDSESHSVNEVGLKERLPGSEQKNDQSVSSSDSTEIPSASGLSTTGDAIPVSLSETPEAFFDSIAQKTQQGLESKELELGALAERLVQSSIYCLCLNHEKESIIMSPVSEERVGDCGKPIATEVVKLLLKEPKDLATKYKGCDKMSSAPELSSVMYTSEDKVREYELQILFRLEILRSKVQGLKESDKQKMMKQICILLDGIQYHLEGGCFGDVSLDRYVGRIIKNRYSQCLPDVVDKIYKKMDLFLCHDEPFSSQPSSQLNSEDVAETLGEKTLENNTPEDASDIPSTSSSKHNEDNSSDPRRLKDKEHQFSLVKAQERRERASRFSSFTHGVKYLQRVWAPKQPKATRGKIESLRKLSKRKQERQVSSKADVVCETPESERKKSCLREARSGNENRIGGSVSKALFQDD
ncbi:hypothetical protein ACHQM5_019639 [Ranunculus cassubicifolius]